MTAFSKTLNFPTNDTVSTTNTTVYLETNDLGRHLNFWLITKNDIFDDKTACCDSLTPSEAKQLRDALIEAYPLEIVPGGNVNESLVCLYPEQLEVFKKFMGCHVLQPEPVDIIPRPYDLLIPLGEDVYFIKNNKVQKAKVLGREIVELLGENCSPDLQSSFSREVVYYWVGWTTVRSDLGFSSKEKLLASL